MGGFYGTVQVRTSDREAVRAAAEAVATDLECRCYLGPELGGWVGIYPSNHGQDTRFGQAVSERMSEPVLHLMVHDDDILAYELWQAGKSFDRYWSCPGYFGEEERAEQEAAAGQPEVLSRMFGGDERELREVLRRDQPVTFEHERLTRLAEMLGIENAVTAYEYLQWGERDGIRGWKQFEELPLAALANEKSAKQERRKQFTAERKRLEKAGLLLAEKKYKGFSVHGLPSGEDQFVVLWQHYANQGGVELWHPPWKQANRTSLTFEEVPHVLVASANGRRLAYSVRESTVVTELGWDAGSTHEFSGTFVVLALSGDGELVALSRRRIVGQRAEFEVAVVRVADGTTVTTASELPEATRGVFSPDGKHLVIVGTDLWLLTLAADGGTVRKMVGGGMPTASLTELYSRAGMVDLSQIISQMEASLEQTVEQASKMMQRSAAKASEEEIEGLKARVREQMEQQIAALREQQKQLASGQLPTVPQYGNERPFRLGFARSGSLAWCATDKGLRVYDWQAVLAATPEMPSPVMQFEPTGNGEHGLPLSLIYDATEAADDAIVFGGLSGVLYRLDLKSGETRQLLQPPEGGALMHLAMTRDGRCLGMTTCPGFPSIGGGGAKQTQVWQVWDYAKLTEKLTHPARPTGG